MQKLLTIVCLLFCFTLTLQASTHRIISGTVYDAKGNVLPGVTISLEKSTNIGTTTDLDGHYVLTLPDDKNYTLKASYMGYMTQYKELQTLKSSDLDFYLQEDVVSLDMVVVTGTRTPKLLKDSPIATRVITENEIRKSDATHIGELLQSELPGIEFSYSMNQQTSLNMQGFGGNSVLFLVDGERLAGETLDNIDYSRLNLDNVERIEIVKGAASSLYGSNAVGGVVNIITKTSKEPWAVNINARLAEYKRQRYGTTASFNTGKFNSTTSIQRTETGEHKMKNDSVGDFSKVYADRTWNFKERLQYRVNDNFKLTGRAGYFFRERDSQENSKDRYRDFSGGLKGEYTFNKKSNIELAYAFDQYDKSDYIQTSKQDIRDYSNVQHSIRGLFNHTFSDKHTLTVGGDFMRDYLMSYQFVDNRNYKQYSANGFAQFDSNITDWFNLIAGIRYDYFSEAKTDHLSSKIGLMFKANHCSLRASYAGGFRAPTLKEMYMNFDMASIFMIYGNSDLKSESSHNLLLTAEYTNSFYNVVISGYYNKVNDRITTSWNQELKGMRYMNIDKIYIKGIDANVLAKYPCGIAARVSYNYTHEDIKKGQPQVSSTRPHSATARIEYGKDWKNYGFNIALSGRYLSKLTTDVYTSLTSYEETQKVSYPGYFIGKLTLMQRVWKGINITMAVDNLFNYVPSYYYNNSPATTGPTFSAGISIDIERLFK